MASKQKEFLVAVTVEVERVYRVKAASAEEAKDPARWTHLEESLEGTEQFQSVEEDEE